MSSMLFSAASGRPTLSDVLPNSLASLRGERGPLGLPTARSAVVMLVDGLGAAMLRSRAGHARRLSAGWRKKDTAFSFPSTTVAGITSLTTATRAGEHGLLGYSLYDRDAGVIRNQLSGWGDGMDPATWQLQRTVFEQLRDASSGVQSIVVGMPQYRDSGLTHASLRGAMYLEGESMQERVEVTLAALDAHPRALIYLYNAELDQAGHAHGWESDVWLARLEELDAAFDSLTRGVDAGIGILVTADHGMIDIPRHRQIDIDDDDPLFDGVIAMAGEPRLRHLYLAPDAHASATEELRRRWHESQSSRATVLTRAAAISEGWYGPVVAPEAAARIGDVIVAATKGVTYYPSSVQSGARLVVGQHGSITPEETIVPLIRAGAYAH
ncbi:MULTISPECIES: alkaline phosphatase family protein [unclassified Pseudoclavibacter]|uniref:alkaline phosphatase family protein n=1 Tax=unclassified Pseudoclavibacter TaxID=2615177 RepID=UPI001BAD89E9|nr:alkaline phosphatase family protein [Pseudoclavibacter sp. Marseille-Q4354]MBS3177881.1 alkaline phosphatase family protein [Pseudoclavibacter sp. Marseille-Q4354]